MSVCQLTKILSVNLLQCKKWYLLTLAEYFSCVCWTENGPVVLFLAALGVP